MYVTVDSLANTTYMLGAKRVNVTFRRIRRKAFWERQTNILPRHFPPSPNLVSHLSYCFPVLYVALLYKFGRCHLDACYVMPSFHESLLALQVLGLGRPESDGAKQTCAHPSKHMLLFTPSRLLSIAGGYLRHSALTARKYKANFSTESR